jgi:hypothetical protein
LNSKKNKKTFIKTLDKKMLLVYNKYSLEEKEWGKNEKKKNSK